MSEYKYLDKDGLIYYHSKIKNLLSGKVDKENGKGLSTNDYTTTEKNKLNGIASGAEVNQNAFSNITVGSTTIAADSKTDTLTIVAGNNITLTPNATSDTLTIAADAEPITIDSEIDSTSENPVQNKVIATALNNKVDKISGKGLSTNDYTTAEKNKLSGIESGAEENIIESIKVNGTAQTITSKEVDIDVPTATSDLTNDSGFITRNDYAVAGTITPSSEGVAGTIKVHNNYGVSVIQSGNYAGTLIAMNSSASDMWEFKSPNRFSSHQAVIDAITYHLDTSLSSSSDDTHYPSSKCVYDAINDAIGSVTGISYEIVQTLPQTGSTGVIYLVSNSGTAPNVYDEYIWLTSSSSFEKIGTTAVDLSGYVQATEMVTITNAEIDTIVAA